MAEYGSKKIPKIIFSNFYRIINTRIFADFFTIFFYFWTQNEPNWLKMGPKKPKKYFFQFFFIKLCIFNNFWWFFQIFLNYFLLLDPKWAKMAENGSKKAPKIFFSDFYQNMYFYKVLVIFSDFFDHSWFLGPWDLLLTPP